MSGSSNGRGGTGTSRARLARPAVRRPTKARLAINGPTGSGKTWTALSVAEVLAPGGRYLVLDTERGDEAQTSAELYADQFGFEVIPWEPPFQPQDLTATLLDLAREPAGERPDVLVIDSATHFWTGEGGTLEQVDGNIRGWKALTPVQQQMVEALLSLPFHVIVCTRAKMDYAIDEVYEDGRKRQVVTKLGMAPIQRADLEYEFQVVVMLDVDHRIAISKTRAQPLSGQTWQANQQGRFAALYKAWLDSGHVLARQADVDALRDVIRRAELGDAWAADGWPKVAYLDADRVGDAWSWLADRLEMDAHGVVAAKDDPEVCDACGASIRAHWHRFEGAVPAGPTVPDAPPPAPEEVPDVPPEPVPPAEEDASDEEAEQEAPAKDRRAEALDAVAASLR